jgi:hypothetical protein
VLKKGKVAPALAVDGRKVAWPAAVFFFPRAFTYG